MQNDKLLYENIKKRRLELNMSQQDLAEAVGYKGKSMISQVENGQIDLPITMVKKFAEALKIDAGDLMGWEDFEIAHDGNILYDKKAALKELLKDFEDIELEQEEKLKLKGILTEIKDYKVSEKAKELYSLYENASPEIQSAVRLLLGSSQQPPESPQKN